MRIIVVIHVRISDVIFERLDRNCRAQQKAVCLGAEAKRIVIGWPLN